MWNVYGSTVLFYSQPAKRYMYIVSIESGHISRECLMNNNKR